MPRPADAIRERIDRDGPITFADFMRTALYGPGGYYERPPIGEGGDFVTGPHVSPVFAALLADGISAAWDTIGPAGPPQVIEVGAGDGTLATQLRDALGGSLGYVGIDVSPGARAALTRHGFETLAEVDQLPEGRTAIVVANELLDNLPAHLVRRNPDGLVELRVGHTDGAFFWTTSPCPPALAAAAPVMAVGEEAAISLDTLRLVERLSRCLERGYLLFIDYERVPGTPLGGVHGYRAHQMRADILTAPGSTDITAPVDLDAVVAAAEDSGMTVAGPVSQRDALVSLGLNDTLTRMRSEQARALDRRDGIAATRLLDARNRAAWLADPDGPGALRWLTLASPGLPPPPWNHPERPDVP